MTAAITTSTIITISIREKQVAVPNCPRHDRPGEWTCDDVEAARLRANELSRPDGHLGPTPQQKWRQRNAVTQDEREVFKGVVTCMTLDVRREKGLGENDALVWYECAGIERKALEKALARLGYLTIRRRRAEPFPAGTAWARGRARTPETRRPK